MAFWAKANDTQIQSRPGPAVGAAKPVTLVLHSSGDFSTLVRLRVRVPSVSAAISLADADVDGEEGEAAAHTAGVAAGKLHQLMLGLEAKSADARKHSVAQVMSPELLQVLCQKAVVAKIYKGLMPHQSALGFQLGDVKSCISLTPLGLWELHEALQTALVKALTGSSSGVSSGTSSHGTNRWVSINGNKLISCDLLAAEPGTLQHAHYVEFETKAQPPNKTLMLIKAAGGVKYRLFSPTQALLSDAKALRPPLQLTDSTEALLADPAKLAAAARQLDGRAVKLLPDERLAFIKSLHPAPTDPKTLDDLHNFWLGHYGLKLPTKNFPFLVGVASHPEAESASLEVPSCCVMTNLGLSVLPGSMPGGSCYSEAVGLLLENLKSSELQLLGGEGFKVETNTGTPAATDAQLQLSQAHSQAAAAVSSYPTLQPKQFSIAASWTTASDLSKLQAAAKAEAATAVSKQVGQQQQKAAAKPPAAASVTTAAAAQLMGLQELEDLEAFVAAAAAAGEGNVGTQSKSAESAAQKPVLGGRRGQRDLNPSRWAKLNEFLNERANQERELKAAALAAAGVPVAAGGAKFSSTAAGTKPAAAAGAAVQRAAVAAQGGPPGVPSFKSRKPGNLTAAKTASRPAAVGAAAKVAGGAAGNDSNHSPDNADAAAGTVSTNTARPQMKKAPAIGAKRAAPASGAAAAKPPAAKKAKAAADGSTVASKPKAKKPPAAANAAAVPAGDSSSAAASTAADPAAATPAAVGGDAGAAAAAAPKRTKTKASDLDVAAVTTKVLAAYASGGGSSLKGLSVPEMQCYLRANEQKGGPTKKAEVEARLLAFLASKGGAP